MGPYLITIFILREILWPIIFRGFRLYIIDGRSLPSLKGREIKREER